MRVIAAIYLTIALINFGFWFAADYDGPIFPTPYSYLTWSMYFLSLFSLLAFVIKKLLLPRQVWQLVFIVYFSTRLYELIAVGLDFKGESIPADLNILASYLWLVLPPGLAMLYLGFAFPLSDSSMLRQETETLKASHS